jgi:hypothetical protein
MKIFFLKQKHIEVFAVGSWTWNSQNLLHMSMQMKKTMLNMLPLLLSVSIQNETEANALEC